MPAYADQRVMVHVGGRTLASNIYSGIQKLKTRGIT
jgi:hypothetical protein